MEQSVTNPETNFNPRQPTSEEEKERIKSLALKGLGVNEIAREVKRSPATVSRLLRRMKISKAITIAKAGKLLDEKLDAAEQLKKINKKANQILDSTDPASPEIVLKAMAEIRGQLKLQLEIFQALYNVNEHQKGHYKWNEADFTVSSNRTESLDASQKQILGIGADAKTVILPRRSNRRERGKPREKGVSIAEKNQNGRRILKKCRIFLSCPRFF